jgi:hypothetical protein
VEKTLHYYSFASFALWIPMLLALLILILLERYQRGKIKKRSLLTIALLASVAQLVIFAKDWLPVVDPTQFPLYPRNAITHFFQNDPSASRFAVWRDTTKDPVILPPNSSDISRINDFTGYESLTPSSMSVFYRKQVPHDSLDLHLLGLANVKYVVTKSRIIHSADAREAFSAGGITIFENLLCKPRSFLAHRCMILNSDSAVGANLIRKDFDGAVALFTTPDMPMDTSGLRSGDDSIQRNGDSIHIIRSENEAIELSADTRSKAILILTDTYYPGWECYVNGQRRDIFRANGYMRAVVLDAGHSTVLFRFEPEIFTAGATTSAIAVLCSLGAIGFLRLHNRKRVV